METTKKDYGFRYSFPGKAAWERKTGKSSDKLFAESIIDGNMTANGIQQFVYIMTYHQNKGAIAPEDIDIDDDEVVDVLTQILSELNRWVAHRNKVLEERAGSAETTTEG